MTVLVGALASCAAPPASTPRVQGPYDDSLVVLGDFRGHASPEGLVFDGFEPSAAVLDLAQREGVSVESLIGLTGMTGYARGNNPPDSYEIVTCQPSLPFPCETQYGTRIMAGFGSEADRCGTVPAGRSPRCYAADTEVRMFYGTGVEVANVYVQFRTITSGGMPYELVPYDGSPLALGMSGPTIGDVYRYGTVESLAGYTGAPGTQPAPNFDSPFHQQSLRRWRLSLPVGAPEDAAFGFTGTVWGSLSAVAHAPHQVSVTAQGLPTAEETSSGCITANSDYTVISSAAALVAEHPTGTTQVYRVRRRTGVVELVSRAADGTPGDGDSSGACLSQDGAIVAFESTATNLVAGDTNGVADIFVRDVAAGATTLVSRGTDGAGASSCGRGGGSNRALLSNSGDVVAFASTCASLCGGNSETTGCFTGRRQVYRFTRSTSSLEGVSVRSGTSGAIGPDTR
jgi:hypothetical protein